MNLLQLILKQMRQRALGTSLTLLSVLLGVALAVSILLLRRGGQSLFAQTDFGYDVLVGTRASPLQLVLNSVYHVDQSPGNVPYWVYEQINTQERAPRGSKEFSYHKHVRTAVPITVGDSYKGRPIIGAPPKMFVSLDALHERVGALADKQRELSRQVRPGTGAEQLQPFAARQAAIGAEVAALKEEINRVGAAVIPLVEIIPPANVPPADLAAMASAAAAGQTPVAPATTTQPASQPAGETDSHDHAHGPATQPTTVPAAPTPGELLSGQPKGAAADDHHDHAGHDHGPPRQWPYGKPVVLRCDAALAQVSDATEALVRNDLPNAVAAQKAIVDALEIVGRTVAAHGGPLHYRRDTPYELASGRVYHAWKFEAVVGSEVAEHLGMTLGTKFKATHGMPAPGQTPDEHAEEWEVVGVMRRTGTAADRCLYIPLISFYTIAEHEEGLEAHEKARLGQAATAAPAPKPEQAGHEGHHHDHTYELAYGDALCPGLPHTKDFINLEIPPSKWEVSAIFVKARGEGGFMGDALIYHLRNGGLRDTTGVNPAGVMREFFDTFLSSSATVLLLIALLVSIVAGVGILVSIYNSVAARNREIAILRALGATRQKVLALICAEAALIGLVGGVVGLIVGHGLGAIASSVMMREVGQGFDWVAVGRDEVVYLGLVVVIAVLAGLVPALKAYRTPVATNLVAA